MLMKTFFSVALSIAFILPVGAADLKVKIDQKLASVEVLHNGKKITIQRNQDQQNTIVSDYALTSRACPPFCIQPMELLPSVTTIGELELLELLKQKTSGDNSLLFIDSRTPDWVAKGTIPGSINIPWTKLFSQASSYEPLEVENILTLQFGAVLTDTIWNFANAKKLIFFCNGPWCGQSPTNIKALVNMGYPAHKIFWYRGGMQAWHSLGLTTVKPE